MADRPREELWWQEDGPPPCGSCGHTHAADRDGEDAGCRDEDCTCTTWVPEAEAGGTTQTAEPSPPESASVSPGVSANTTTGGPEALARVVIVFITKARDEYGLGRFMPDELPLLNEMARLARLAESELQRGCEAERERDEQAALAEARRYSRQQYRERAEAAEARLSGYEQALRELTEPWDADCEDCADDDGFCDAHGTQLRNGLALARAALSGTRRPDGIEIRVDPSVPPGRVELHNEEGKVGEFDLPEETE